MQQERFADALPFAETAARTAELSAALDGSQKTEIQLRLARCLRSAGRPQEALRELELALERELVRLGTEDASVAALRRELEETRAESSANGASAGD